MVSVQSKREWLLIPGLAALALIRPIMSMLGLSRAIGQPFASIAVTLLISLVWLAVAVRARFSRPIVTLTLTGLVYGIFAVLISAVLSPVLTGQLQGPATNAVRFRERSVDQCLLGTGRRSDCPGRDAPG